MRIEKLKATYDIEIPAGHIPLRVDTPGGGLSLEKLFGGRDYDPEFGVRMTGQGEWAVLLKQRFDLACRRLGLAHKLPPLRRDLFAVPAAPGDQLDLFG